jgi:hypothetical protein
MHGRGSLGAKPLEEQAQGVRAQVGRMLGNGKGYKGAGGEGRFGASLG